MPPICWIFQRQLRGFSSPKIKLILSENEVDENDASREVDEDGHQGPEAATILTTDLSADDGVGVVEGDHHAQEYENTCNRNDDLKKA